MWNHYAHLESYFGIPAAGGVLHPLNLRLHPDEIAWIANHAQDRFLIVDDVLLPVLEKFASKVKFERIFVVRHPGESAQHGYIDYEDWLKRATGSFTPRRSAKMTAPACATPRGPRAIPRACFIPTARRCCTA